MRIGHCILNRHYQFQPGAGRSSAVSARPHGRYTIFRLVEMVSMPAQRLLPRVVVVFRLNRRATRRRKIPRARFCPLATFGSQDHAAGASTYPPSKRHSLAGTRCLPEITWLREVVFYHGVVGRLADTMVKVSQNDGGVAVV